MKQRDDHELVRIKMMELRRLQGCDRDNARLRARNQFLEDLLKRVLTHSKEVAALLESALEENNG